jgi:hypothetical protein
MGGMGFYRSLTALPEDCLILFDVEIEGGLLPILQ